MYIDEEILGYRVKANVNFYMDSFGVHGSDFVDCQVEFISVLPVDTDVETASRRMLEYIKDEIVERYGNQFRYPSSYF